MIVISLRVCSGNTLPRLGEILLALDVSLAVLLVLLILLVVVHCALGQLSVLVFLLMIRILIHILMLLHVAVFRVLHLVHVHLLHLIQGLKHALVVVLGLLHFFLEVDVILVDCKLIQLVVERYLGRAKLLLHVLVLLEMSHLLLMHLVAVVGVVTLHHVSHLVLEHHTLLHSLLILHPVLLASVGPNRCWLLPVVELIVAFVSHSACNLLGPAPAASPSIA